MEFQSRWLTFGDLASLSIGTLAALAKSPNALFGPAPCGRLACALSRCNVASLELSDNEIGDEGAWELAWRLPECAELRHLGLAVNEIEEDGAAELLGHLSTGHAALTSLDLRGNRIAPKSAASEGLAATGLANLRFQRAARAW